MTTPAKRAPGIVLLLVLVAGVGYLIAQAVFDNADDPHAIGHALLLIGALVVVCGAVGWLVRRR